MSTTKKPVASLAKKETEGKTSVTEGKTSVTEVKASVAEVKAPVAEEKAAKETVKKAAAKKEAPAAEAKETTKKTAAKKTTTAKAAKASKSAVKVAIQFADKNYTTEDLAKIANDVWVYDYGKKASELKDVQLYVKPEEAKVYYVFNNEIAGDFNI